MSLSVLFALSAVLHLYIGARLVPHLPLVADDLFALLLSASSLLVPGALLAHRLLRQPAADRSRGPACCAWGCSPPCWC